MLGLIARIGIDQLAGDVYESYENYWRIAQRSHLLSEAVLNPQLPVQFDAGLSAIRYLFREDAFDAVVRVRRGRFYELANQMQPSEAYTLPNPSGEYFNAPRRGDGLFRKSLFIHNPLPTVSPTLEFAALGAPDSLWRVIAPPERISTGEFLFTLKARNSMGVLPAINRAAVPQHGRSKVVESLETLIDAANRADPSSVIDRARAAAQCCLGNR